MSDALDLAFARAPALLVELQAEQPALDLAFARAPALLVELQAEQPALGLSFRAPDVLDAALLPVLIGPPGQASPDVSRTLSWSAGLLASVDYADGRQKLLTWADGQLTRVDLIAPGLPTQRADLYYNPDGTLSGVLQSEI